MSAQDVVSPPVFQIKPPATAAEILAESLIDIEKFNAWRCNEFICAKDRQRDHNKPAGCALGLIGINGGNLKLKAIGSLIVVSDKDAEEEGACLEWNSQSQEAIMILAEIAGKRRPGGTADAYQQVIEYNDNEIRDPIDAAEWFREAAQTAKKRGV